MRFTLLLFLLFPFTLFAQTLSGRITDRQGMGVAGASVRLLNTDLGTVTSADGQFSLPNVPAGATTLFVTAVGYAGQTLRITAGQSNVVITLADAATSLDEVVVSADKAEQVAQRLPSAVSTITRRDVEEYRLWNLPDVTALAPTFATTNAGDDKNFMSIRGITSASFDQPVAVYLDGVNQFRLSTAIPTLNDVERIEILRGPQGTLYGRNAMGGVINIITRQPTNQTTGFGEISAGNFGQFRTAFGVRTPLVKDKLFLGASVLYDSREGFFTNQANGQRFDQYRSLTGNYSLRWLASPRFSATVNVKQFNRRNKGSYPLIPYDNFRADTARYRVNYDAVAEDVDNTLFASGTLRYFGRGWELTSISAYQQATRYYNGAIDADVQVPFALQSLDITSIRIRPDGGQNTYAAWTQELRAQSTPDRTGGPAAKPLGWTVGTYLFSQDYPTSQTLLAGRDAGIIGFEGAPFGLTTNIRSGGAGVAFFGQLTYRLGERTTLTAGGRYDNETQRATVGSSFSTDQFSQVTLPDTTGRTRFGAFTYKLSLAHQTSATTLLYATASRGYRAGGLSQIGFDPSEAPLVAFQPEYSNNFEIGAKGQFLDNKLRVNGALFFIDVTNAQIPALIPALGFRQATTNAGNFTSRGIELTVQATPARGLQFDWNLGVVDARYNKLTVPVSDPQTGDAFNQDFKGNRQILTPAYTSLVAVQYGRNVARDLQAFARLEYRAVGEQYFDLPNRYKQDAYGLVNARAGVQHKRYGLAVWARNLTDRYYAAYGFNFGAVTPGAPRTYGVTLSGSF